MANTTDIMIVCFDEPEIIRKISFKTGILFRRVSNNDMAGGHEDLTLQSYGYCGQRIQKEKLEQIKQVFKDAKFRFPEVAVMIIQDDRIDCSEIITRL